MRRFGIFVALAAAAMFANSASAVPVNVLVQGTVEFNVIGGNQANVPDGAPVSMRFNVDSDVFVNSPNFPTRGYPLDLSSFEMLVGGNPIEIIDPQPFGATAYFVLRNNDPAVDGVFLSQNVDFPIPLGVTIPGLSPDHELDFLRTFNDGTPFPSLDILDALGTYSLENLSSFDWSVGRFGNDGAFYLYETMTISIVPEPGALALLALWGLPLLVLRRK